MQKRIIVSMAGGASSRLAQQSRTRSVIAALLFTAFLWALALSVSPELHAAVHSHAAQAGHTCVATLIGSGQYENSAPATICLGSDLLVSSPRRNDTSSLPARHVNFPGCKSGPPFYLNQREHVNTIMELL
jgi:hypothetical protein